METVYCPNGHPNSADTWYCSTCLVPMKPADVEEPETEPRARSSPGVAPATPPLSRPPTPLLPLGQRPITPRAPEPLPVEEPPPPPVSTGRRRLWLWLLLILALAGLAACTLLALLVVPWARYNAETLTGLMIPSSGEIEEPMGQPAPTFELALGTDQGEVEPLSLPTEELPTTFPTPTPIIGVVLTPTIEFTEPVTNVVALNLIQNGDFSDDWANGWTDESSDTNGVEVIELLPAGFDVPGQVLSLGKTGTGTIQLSQRVVLNDRTINAVFRGRVRQIGSVDEAGNEGRSAIMLIYESADGTPQGASIWLDGAADETSLWGESPLVDLGPNLMARLSDTNDWQAIDVPLELEFREHLPGINSEDIRQVTILLLLIGSDNCLPAACLTTLEAADLQLTVPFP
jgi:hypothetical protein